MDIQILNVRIGLKKGFRKGDFEKVLILFCVLILLYLLVSIYFTRHFFFHTTINGVNVSLKSYKDVEEDFQKYINNYKLLLQERNGETEVITGQEIDMKYHVNNSISIVQDTQKSLFWCPSLYKKKTYIITDIYHYNDDILNETIKKLKCLNNRLIEPRNVSFQFTNGQYNTISEEYGNKVIIGILHNAITSSILSGNLELNLDQNHCYENPEYTLTSDKTKKTLDKLNKYVSTKVTYKFGKQQELLDGNVINPWLTIDNDLDVEIKKQEVELYIKSLSKRYDTIGIAREFKASTGKKIEVKGGIYGWKINQVEEVKALIKHILLGEAVVKEPAYLQTAVSREKDDIGNTYVEINITKQHLWFYKNGTLIIQGAVVTGNPNRGNATVIGTNMLNYKQKSATLKGVDYEVIVKYWMPFYGNMGIHDANWRHSFGREIYKRNGTHGCVNAPIHLAKTIFDNIEAGTPVIIYEE
jgi:hypothetical protein